MKELKRLAAILAILAVLTISTIVAFRLAPETWAVLVGILFGLVATLPMCAIVVLMLRQHPAPPPAPPLPVPPPQIVFLTAGTPVPPAGARLPQLPAMLPAWPGAATTEPAALVVRDWDSDGESIGWAGSAAGSRPAPARSSVRILGQ